MAKEAPRITMYSRVISNTNGNQIIGYKDMNSTTQINFGKISGISGGESSIVVEFDIWNNEPAFSGGMIVEEVEDVYNCTFTAWDKNGQTTDTIVGSNGSYIYARNVTNGYDTPFKQIYGLNGLNSEDIFGNISSVPGVLRGNGDHTIIQVKIVIPPGSEANLKNFAFDFSYDYND